MRRPYGRSFVCFFILCALLAEEPLQAQEIGTRLGERRGGEISYELQGSGVLFDALDPAVKKWYVPQELFYEFQWRQWQYSNYARSHYLRYVNTSLEGDYFYDLYGNFITRGKLVYDWRVSTPQVAGNALFKGSEFRSWFNNLVIASDSKGQYFYSLTVGDRIRTTLTPMTFSKPSFTGMQFDVASDKYEFTLLASRPSAAGAVGDQGPTGSGERSNDTNLLGARGTVQLGDFVQLGTTYVSAFNAQTKNQAFSGNPFRGTLTEGQNNDVSRIEIRLSDDSPEDGDGGAAFFQEEIIITNIDGKRFSNRRRLDDNSILNFFPTIQGGFRQEGFLSADGSEVITLIYDLEGPEYRQAFGPAPDRIKSVEFVLLLANDYRIDLTSNRQVNQKRQPVTLSEGIPERTIRAPGNVKDGSNQRFISLHYGLPVGNEIFGFTLDVENAYGFFLAGEFAHNRQHKRYPRRLETDVTEHTPSLESGDAWFLNLYKRAHPLFFFAETYSMDPNYSTSTFLAGIQNDLGPILYDDNRQFVYEFVEDNDDQDRFPDWFRRGFTRDTEVFPGWDENRDFIVDFNQNDNLRRPNTIPDYEEPFLRYSSDRPDFLFGIDMNNNGIVDRFENDTQPDYLYKRDRRGYNIYVGSSLGPDARLSVGRQRERQLADERQNKSTYLLLTYEKDFPRLGRLQFYDNLRRVEDDIRDNVIEWVLREGSRGDFVPFEDPLPARNAWANTLYLGYRYAADKLRFVNRFKYEVFHQVDFAERPFKQQQAIREVASLLGIINKAEYTFNLGALRLEPRWKNEFLRYRPTRKEDQIRVATTELRELLSLIGRISILSRTTLQVGLEYFYVNQFREILENDPVRSDRNELIYALQLTNNVAYLGYDLWAQAGIHIARVDRKAAAKAHTESSLFLTLYAGFGE